MTITRREWMAGAAGVAGIAALPAVTRAAEPVTIDTPLAAPQWALLQRRLLAANAEACEAFYRQYVDERHWLKVFERWGANDGPDDAAEATNDWLLLHALGGSDRILDLSSRFFDGHVEQYTAAHTELVPIAREGMYHREFVVQMDWQHISEGLSSFNCMGLSAPRDAKLVERTRRFADFYTGANPSVGNYDPQHRIMRSMMNGSRGPMLRHATALDWAGDPFDVSRFHMEHGERTYEETLAHYDDYTEVIGDNPLNLQATTLGLNAYALGSGDRFRQWALEYLDAWVDRAAANNGILPSNVGLDGEIGSSAGGRWWGGTYGWGFSPIVPQTGERQDRNRVPRSITAFMNGTLLSGGDSAYMDVWRRQNAVLNEQAREVDGVLSAPTMYGADGWYGWRPGPYRQNAFEIWYMTQSPQDRALAGDDPWVSFLEGSNPGYPEEALNADFARIAERVALRLADHTEPETRLADWPIPINPASVKSLVQLMTGGLHIARPSWSRTSPPQGGVPLHSRLRYFDPEARRAGVPDDVAALVHTLGDTSTEVTLVNLGDRPRTVVVQGGAYAEHRIESISIDGRSRDVGAPAFTLRLAPRSGARLNLSMRRYANRPTLAFPWDRT